MREQIAPRLAKWPFFLSDLLLLGIACFIIYQSTLPVEFPDMVAVVLCVALGALLGVTPFLLEYKAGMKLAEADGLASVVSQLKNLEQLAARISDATARWQTVQEAADKTGRIATEITERMAGEIKGFNEFLQRANEGEKSTLRLEAEKLRRAEAEWLQVLVRMLDHVYALHQAGVRSRQSGLIEQLGQFQNACRDVARRVGLTAFIAAPDEPFDEQRHQHVDDDSKPSAGVAVEETVATGYTFQGKLLRPALVRVRSDDGGETTRPNTMDAGAQAPPEAEQNQLTLDSPPSTSP